MLGLRVDQTYFDSLETLGNNIFRIAEIARMLSIDINRVEMYMAQSDMVVNESQELITEFINKVHNAFITPFDKEDFVMLARTLQRTIENINDLIFSAHDLRVNKPSDFFQKNAEFLVELAGYYKEAVGCLRTKSGRQEMAEVLRRAQKLKNDAVRYCWRLIGEFIDQKETIGRNRLKWVTLAHKADRTYHKILDGLEILEILYIKHA